MARTVGIGIQNFEKIRLNQYFYIDKTNFIKEWWESGDDVTLITRPRRFGKTLTLNMVEQFFSISYADREDLFQGLSIWKEEPYRLLQGTYPVIALSFANVKETSFQNAKEKIGYIIQKEFNKHDYLLNENLLNQKEKNFFNQVSAYMENYVATSSLETLSEYLYRYYNKKVIILLDEYDTPLQEAYLYGYWEELVAFIRNLLNSTFKTNPYMERAIMTGITRISKESIFSDLNNLTVITTTSIQYADSFGFTEKEVRSSLAEYNMSPQMQKVKRWYNGFIFGECRDIYNPWSILNYLKTGKLSTYWANTNSNSLIGKLIREGNATTKILMEDLLHGKTFHIPLDEQIVFHQLHSKNSAIWSLLLASGYLRVEHYTINEKRGKTEYDLALTNKEVFLMFEQMIEDWFSEYTPAYNEFIKALLQGDKKAMNSYMNQVALATFSYFDTGKKPSEKTEPERFYHGFVLGLIVDLADRYTITSNRESGFGRYDVLLEPHLEQDCAIILEFKVHDPEEEKTLKDTVDAALKQIKQMNYSATLQAKGIHPDRIRTYGFAFKGKTVLIG